MSPTANHEENKRTVRRFVHEVSGEGDVELVDEICTEDVIDHTALGETSGREALKETFEGLNAAFPTHENTIEEIIAEGDTVAIRSSSRMTHGGDFMGIEPTGREVRADGTSFFRLRDGQIAERWAQFDVLGMIQQLGVVELPGARPSRGTMETVTSADGTPIAYERTGSGPPLVLVHGSGLDHGFWDLSSVRAALAEHHTVYAIDRRGRGGSGDAAGYELEREVEDVAAVVGSIDDPVTLVGHSYGALVALEVADRIDTLRGLVLYEPPFGPGIPPEIEQLLEAIEALIADGEKEEALVTELTAVGLPETYIAALRSNPNWQALVDTVETLPREFEQFFEYELNADRLAGMTTPTVLFTGEESHPSLVAVTETVDETLPDSRIVRIDGTAHFGLLSEADRFVEEVLALREERQG